MDQKTILIADDDEEIVRVLSVGLRSAGYNVLAAMDGTQAFMLANRQPPDLLILDIKMPAGDGFAVIDKLHHSIKTMNIPVIIYTGLEIEYPEKRARELGVRAIFKKPADPAEILEAIGEILSGGPGGDST